MTEKINEIVNGEINEENLEQVAGGFEFEDGLVSSGRPVIRCRVDHTQNYVAFLSAPTHNTSVEIARLHNNDIFEAYPSMFDHTGTYAFGRLPGSGVEGWVERQFLFLEDGRRY